MSDDEINIAVAEACGWIIHGPDGVALRNPKGEIVNQHYGEAWRLPNFCTDLNAMHEATQGLINSKPGYWEWYYASTLVEVLGYTPDYPDKRMMFSAIQATARQRAEAFLRTIGKWKEPLTTKTDHGTE